jgi:hypothetical protein
LRHRSREEDHLCGLGQKLEDVVDLLSETTLACALAIDRKRLEHSGTYREHFVSLVQDKHLHAVGLQEAALDHVVDTSRSAYDDLGTLLKSLHIVTNARATNAGMALDAHEIANGHNDLLDLLGEFTGRGKDKSLALLEVGVDFLEDGDGECCRLAGTGLRLGNDIVSYGVALAS